MVAGNERDLYPTVGSWRVTMITMILEDFLRLTMGDRASTACLCQPFVSVWKTKIISE